jgi:hypothetical protein
LSAGVGTAVANATAGLFNNTDELQPGSRISIGGVSGTVIETGFFAVRILVDSGDSQGDVCVVPNNSFLQTSWYVRAPAEPDEESMDEFDGKNLDRIRSLSKTRAKNK